MTEVADPSTAAPPRAPPGPRRRPRTCPYRPRPARSSSGCAARASPPGSRDERRARARRVRVAAGRAATACTRRTWTCAPPRWRTSSRRTRRPRPPPRRRARAPTGSPRWPRSRRTGVASIALSDAGAPGRRHRWRRSAASSRRDPRPPAALLAGTTRPPADDKLAQLSLAGLEPGRRRARARGRRARRADRRALGGGRARPRDPRPHDRRARRWRRGVPRRGARAVRRRRRRAARRCSPTTTEIRLGRRRPARDGEPPGARTGPGRVPAAARRDRRGRRPPLGARAARRPARPLARGQRARGRPEHGRAGRDRVRLRRPAPRPDLVHAPRRPRHDGPAAQQGRAARPRAELHEGPDHDREERGRHRQLPRRVRDEPLEGRPAPSRSRRWRSTSRTAAARRTRRRSARSTRRSCSTSRAAGIPPDDARKFIVLGFLEPVVARVPLEDAQDRLREALEAKWAAGLAAGASGGRRGLTHRRRRRRPVPSAVSRRIDLLGVDELAEGEMRMVWVDADRPRPRRPRERRVPRPPGHLLARVLRARPRVPDRRHAHLCAPPVALRPDRRRAARPAGRAAARGVPGRDRRRAGHDRASATARSRSTRRPMDQRRRRTPHVPVVYLETERLILRRFTRRRPRRPRRPSTPIRRSCATSPAAAPTPREEMRDDYLPVLARLLRPRRRATGFWAAIERATGAFLGWFHLRPHPEDPHDEPELGYRLVRRGVGRGYATEGSRALVDKAFAELGARRVVRRRRWPSTRRRGG